MSYGDMILPYDENNPNAHYHRKYWSIVVDEISKGKIDKKGNRVVPLKSFYKWYLATEPKDKKIKSYRLFKKILSLIGKYAWQEMCRPHVVLDIPFKWGKMHVRWKKRRKVANGEPKWNDKTRRLERKKVLALDTFWKKFSIFIENRGGKLMRIYAFDFHSVGKDDKMEGYRLVINAIKSTFKDNNVKTFDAVELPNYGTK